MKLTKEDKERVAGIVSNAMDAPADDEMVAAMYSAYKASCAAGDCARDPKFEKECEDHLRGTVYG